MGLNKLTNTIESIKEISEKHIVDISREDLKIIIQNIKDAFRHKDYAKLKEKIDNITKTFVINWKNENTFFVKKIISNININKGIPLPVLSICGKGTREIRFTKYLSYFLNPQKEHGLKDKFLKAVLEHECGNAGLSPNWYGNCIVISEIYLGEIREEHKSINCYGDIGIIGEDFIIIIEQKILSSESDHPDTDLGQLERYNIALKNNLEFSDKKQIKIYLTPDGKQEIDIHGWLPMTHREIIDRAIKLLKLESISNVGRENLLRLLIDLAIGPYEVLENTLDEIVYIANKLMNEKFNLRMALKFNRLIEENEQVIKLLLEG